MKNIFMFFPIIKNKRGLSTAISTLMTLTAAVVLSGSVVLYAANVSTSQMSKEKLTLPSTHVWYVNSTSSVAGIALTNTGTTDVIVNKVNVNGINTDWNGGNTSFTLYNKTDGAFPGDLAFADIAAPATTTISFAGQSYQFQAATQGLTLKAGSSMALYIALPNNIMAYDMGQPVNVVVTTTQAVYATETNVQSPG